jgi:hypothetical protein
MMGRKKDCVSVPKEALKWLVGLGDSFTKSDNAIGAFWWRSEFCRRAGISDDTIRAWAVEPPRPNEKEM